jgi:hypothetical protein
MMRVKTLATFAAGAFLGLAFHAPIAEGSEQIRLRCAGVFTASHLTTGPNIADVTAMYLLDFDRASVTDLVHETSMGHVQLEVNGTTFSTATGAAEYISRRDGSWTIAGTDGTINGFCIVVPNRNVF